MDYEKAYKEALERAKILYNDKNEIGYANAESVLEEVFPLLKESGDENVRKEILQSIRDNMVVIHKDECIAWLEKQAEQKPTLRERYKNIAESEWFKKTHEGMSISDDEKVDNVNKIEPKFKVDDWVVDNNGKVAIIYDLQKAAYVGHYTDGTDFICKYNNEYLLHLWTIQDAKDGDVLASELCDSIILFRGIKDDNIDFYCDYDFSKIDIPGDRFAVNNGQHYGNVEDSKDFHPATKEQRDLLFTKMREAEYEWDAEKKELKKIEQNPAVFSEKKPKRMISAEAKEAMYDKPACVWSEEDENVLEDIEEAIINYWHGDTQDILLDWLKSLRLQKQWKPSDEQMKQLGWIAKQNKDNMIGKELISLYQDLKKLREE